MSKTFLSKKQLGNLGEEIAVKHLTKIGFSILGRNVRFGALEIDIIAKEGDVLVIVEVKASIGNLFGTPEGVVSKRQHRHLIRAGVIYLERNPNLESCRFDVVLVSRILQNQAHVDVIRNAFHPFLL